MKIIKLKYYFSIHFLESVDSFIENIKEIENKETITGEERTKHLGYVLASISLSVCALESFINEFYEELMEKQITTYTYPKVSKEKKDIFGHLWSIEKFRNFSILEKYQCALSLLANKSFDKSGEIYQNCLLLINLRNYFIHYKPEWIDVNIDEENYKTPKWEMKLKNKFSLNTIGDKENENFPYKYLGLGCSEWSIKATLLFIDNFFRLVELDYTYQNHLDKIKKKYCA